MKGVIHIRQIFVLFNFSQVPCPCEGNTQSFKSMKFLITAAEEKDKRIRMWKRLSLEIIDASRNEVQFVVVLLISNLIQNW